MHIDMSNTPQIRIPSDYFLQFKHLYSLRLTKCGQRGPIYLPNTIKDIRLQYNSFTIDALIKMLSNKVPSLKRFYVNNNQLQPSDAKTLLTLLPAELTVLDIGGNRLTILPRTEMMRFKDIQTLYVGGCSLKKIEPNTFDLMKNLSQLALTGNSLDYLPDDLFKFNTRLSYLALDDNRLVEFNATKLGLRNLIRLYLSNNRILKFDLQSLRPVIVLLNNNKIQNLGSKIFRTGTHLGILVFSNNKITHISRDAFRGINSISQLLMNDNSIYSLPQGIFKGKKLNTIYLQSNQLSTLNGVFDGIQNSALNVILVGNKNLTSLNGEEFQSLQKNSTIYINCERLKRISNLSKLTANVVCTPNSEQNISVYYYVAKILGGYKCNRIARTSVYKCSPCRPGYHSIHKTKGASTSTCVKCPAGSYYQNQAAAIKCESCRPGQFVPPERSPGKDASDCQTCPQGTDNTIIAGKRACICLPGYSRRYRFGQCNKCTEHGFNCSLDYKILHNGFWMTWQGTSPKDTISLENHTAKERNCEYVYKAFIRNLDITDDTYDRRTMHFNCDMPIPIKCPLRGSCIGGIEPRCAAGYTGVLCAVCKRGYSLNVDRCVKCAENLWTVIQPIIYIAIFVFICFIVSVTDQITIQCDSTSLRAGETRDHRTLGDVILSNLKILIGFYQVLIIIIYALPNVNWPENLRTIITAMQYIQFQIIHLSSLRCINSKWSINAVDEVWIILISIITVTLFAVVYYFIKSLYIHYQCSSPSQAKKRKHVCGRNCIKFVGIFLFVSYTLISAKTFEILPITCHSFCTAKQQEMCAHSMSFLSADYSIPCPTTADGKTTLVTGYSCLTFPLGVPVLLYVLLRWSTPRPRTCPQIQNSCIIHQHNENPSHNGRGVFSIHGNPLFEDSIVPMMTSALKFTYENYHSRYWYWEVIEMIRKLLMIISAALHVGHTKTGLTCTIIVAMFFSILHGIVKPFKNTFESGAQFLSLILILLNLAFVAVLQPQDLQRPTIINNEMDSFSLGGLLMVLNLSLFIAIGARLIFIICKNVSCRK